MQSCREGKDNRERSKKQKRASEGQKHAANRTSPVLIQYCFEVHVCAWPEWPRKLDGIPYNVFHLFCKGTPPLSVAISCSLFPRSKPGYCVASTGYSSDLWNRTPPCTNTHINVGCGASCISRYSGMAPEREMIPNDRVRWSHHWFGCGHTHGVVQTFNTDSVSILSGNNAKPG